jgi:2-iminobutanoate/2-iminopropanoate deaminase
MRQAIATPDAPKALGPYCQAIRANGFLFLSGQIAIDPATNQFVGGDIAVQTRRVLENIGAILAAAGSSFDRVVKTTVFLADLAEFAAMNDVYAEFFPNPAPARATLQAARLPRDARLEIDAVAVIEP